MAALGLFHGRRRRPTFLLFVVLATFTFLYSTDRIFSSTPTTIPKAPIPAGGAMPAPPGQGQPSSGGGSATAQQLKDDDIHMDYGTSSRPPFEGFGELTKLGKLAADHLPAKGNDKRLIIIGDVHGMITPLQALLAKINFNAESGRDHLVFVGNMVSHGPDSAAVVSLAHSLGASGVRGVHEDRVLLAREAGAADAGAHDDLEQQHLSHGDYADRVVAEALTPQQVEYLRAFPVILELGHIPTLSNAFVVHAGLVPGLDLDLQDPWPAMHMRSVVYPREAARRKKATKKVEDDLHGRTGLFTAFVSRKAKEAMIDAEHDRTRRPWDRDLVLPVDDYSGEDWARAWDAVEAPRAEAERRSIFYGHDTKHGLSIGTNAFGLNSKCVYGGQLSAVVILGTASGVQTDTVQVDCEKEANPVDD